MGIKDKGSKLLRWQLQAGVPISTDTCEPEPRPPLVGRSDHSCHSLGDSHLPLPAKALCRVTVASSPALLSLM